MGDPRDSSVFTGAGTPWGGGDSKTTWNLMDSVLGTGAGTPWGGGDSKTTWNPMDSALGTGAGLPWSAENKNGLDNYLYGLWTSGATLDTGGQARANANRDTNFAFGQAQQEAQWDAEAKANQEKAAKEKANQDYLTNYNKGLADEEALKALEDARAASRKEKGRQINFFW